jgi:RNA polymerase sigma factor (TIGR02999 family)
VNGKRFSRTEPARNPIFFRDPGPDRVKDLQERLVTPDNGNHGNGERRMAGAYDELRRLAYRFLARQSPAHTLEPTALVHEAYLRLIRQRELHGMEVGHFFAVAARAMRSVLVDHARRRNRRKRGGEHDRVPLDDIVDLYQQRATDLIALDEALDRLAAIDADQAQVVEMRFFGGLTEEETAAALGVSPRTVGRIWRRSRAWLRKEMGEGKNDVP